MKTDTKVILAGAVLVVLGAWYVKRQVSGAAGAAWDGFSSAAGAAWDGLAGGVSSAFDAASSVVGGKGYTDANGTYTPYGAVPDSFRAETGTYLGGWGSTAVAQATQADARRVDNAIDATGTGRTWWEVMATQSAPGTVDRWY
jgi:hypothetical protein